MLFTLAVLPAIALMIFIYKKDKKEKEPIRFLWKLFLWGIFLALPVAFFETFLDLIVEEVTIPGSIGYAVIEGFIVAACSEELGKYIVLRLKTWKSKHFDCMFDGIVYSVFVSLGFATIENIAYVLDGDISIAIIRMLSSVPGHACDAVFMGYYYSLAKLASYNGDKKLYKKYRNKAIVLPILLHGFYDCLIMMDYEVAGEGITVLATLVWLVFVITLFANSFKLVSVASKNDEYMDKSVETEETSFA